MAYTPQITLFPGDVGRCLNGRRVVELVNLLSLRVNRSLLLYVTGANDPNCTWVEADNIDMKALAECRVKLHLQVHDARRVSARCCAVYHVIDPTSTTVVFNGGLFTAKQLAAKLCFGMRAISDIEDCGKFRSTLSKVLLLSREVRNNVWVWCDDVLPCWEEFCSKVQQDLQDRVCLTQQPFTRAY